MGAPAPRAGADGEGRAGASIDHGPGSENGPRAGRPRRGRRVCAGAVRASLHNEPLCKADRKPGATARRDVAPGWREAEVGGRQGLATVFFVNDFEKMTAKWIGV